MAEQMLVSEESKSTETRTMETSDVEEEIFEVERIIGKTKIKGATMYKVRWKGYGPADDTWEPRDNLDTCHDLIDDYLHKQSELVSRKHEDKQNKVPAKPTQLSSSEDDSTATFKNSFYDDLEAGRINLFESDMYSKVKGRACRPSCLKDTDSDVSSANEKKGKKRTLSNPEKGTEKTKCPAKNMKSKSTSKVMKKHVSKLKSNTGKRCSQKIDFKQGELTDPENVSKRVNKSKHVAVFTSDSETDSEDKLPAVLVSAKDKHEKMSAMSECSTATINYSLIDDDNAENSCHGIPAVKWPDFSNSAGRSSMLDGSALLTNYTSAMAKGKTSDILATRKPVKETSEGLFDGDAKQLKSDGLCYQKHLDNKLHTLDHNSNLTGFVTGDLSGHKQEENDGHKSLGKKKHHHKHNSDKSHRSLSSSRLPSSHTASTDPVKVKDDKGDTHHKARDERGDSHHRSSHKDDHGHRHRHRSKEKKSSSGKRKSSCSSRAGSTERTTESDSIYGKMPKLVPEVSATTECQMSRLSIDNKVPMCKNESSHGCDTDNQNRKQTHDRQTLATDTHLSFQRPVNKPESFHSRSRHISLDHTKLGASRTCTQSLAVVKPELDNLRDGGIASPARDTSRSPARKGASQSMEDVLRKSGLPTVPSIKHEKTSDPLDIELDDADWQLFEQEVRLEPITITNQEFAKAVATGDYELVKRAFKGDGKYDLENADSSGKTLLMIAVEKVYDDIADLLIEHGALVNAQTNDGNTALMLASKHAEISTVNLLLELGAKVNLEQATKNTALLLAAERGHKQMLWMLLECGANFNHMNEAGYTSLSYCKILHGVDTETIITSHISRVQQEFDQQVSITLNKTASTISRLFPAQVYNVSEGEKFLMKFHHKLQPPVAGVGYLLFIAHAMFTNGDVKCRFYGPCAVKSVLLNGHLQSSLTEEANFVLAFSPLANGTNVLTINTVRAPDVKAKMIVCAYKAQLVQ